MSVWKNFIELGVVYSQCLGRKMHKSMLWPFSEDKRYVFILWLVTSLWDSANTVVPSAFVFISVGSWWPYIFGSLFSSLQICTGLSGCHCWACVQTHPYSRVQADCLLPVRCCECGLTDKRHHRVFAETQQDRCPRWDNSVYQGEAVLLALEINLFLLRICLIDFF